MTLQPLFRPICSCFAALVILTSTHGTSGASPREAVRVRNGTLIARLDAPCGVSVAASRDGSRILTAGEDDARVWDGRTFKVVSSPLRHDEDQRARISLAAISADGAMALTVVDDRVRLWDTATGKPRGVLRHKGVVRSAMFSSDGALIVTGADDKFARVWDARTGEQVASREHRAAVYSVEISADGQKVLSVARFGVGPQPQGAKPRDPASRWTAAFLWSSRSGRDLIAPNHLNFGPYRGDEPWHRSAALSPDGSRFATAEFPAQVSVRDSRTGEVVAAVPCTDEGKPITGGLGRVLFTPDGRHLLTSGTEVSANTILWDAATGEFKMWVRGMAEYTQFSADGLQLLITSEINGSALATVVDVKTGKTILFSVETKGRAAPPATFLPDGKVAVSIAREGYTGIWELQRSEKE